jgi:hypothetical protein
MTGPQAKSPHGSEQVSDPGIYLDAIGQGHLFMYEHALTI